MSASAPPRIARGQTLGIVAPAGPVRLESLRRGLDRLGGAFRLKLAPSLGGARDDGEPSYIAPPREPGVPSYLAASDDVRAAELNAMLADRDVRAILLARGGYGLMRILPRLDVAALRADPKPIVGFSDATALLAWAYAAGVRGIHGPMGVQMERLSDGDIAHLVALLTDPRAPGVRPWSLAAHGRGVYRGPLIAANLTMMSVLAGTPWALAIRGAIGLVEEVGERPYEIDRYLTHLVLAGELSKIAAMIIGDLTRCEDAAPPLGTPDPPGAALATVLERLHAAGTPAAAGAPIGHGDRNEAVPFGATSVLDLDAGTLEITEGAVSA